MKASEARDLTPDQLNDRLLQLKKEQFNLRFQRASGQLERTARIGEVRRDISRIKTILTQKDAPASTARPAAKPRAAKPSARKPSAKKSAAK